MLTIKKLRIKNNLSQAELAEKLHVTQGAISHWETAEATPNIEKLPELAKILNCTINDLFNAEE
jgi:transcriptional regulator with XRE-family HTH domain